LEQAAGEIESLRAESDKLTVERGRAESELANNTELLAGVAEQAEALQAEPNQLADVLKWPGLRNLLLRTSRSH
jgi:chromosome segregation ATPase